MVGNGTFISLRIKSLTKNFSQLNQHPPNDCHCPLAEKIGHNTSTYEKRSVKCILDLKKGKPAL